MNQLSAINPAVTEALPTAKCLKSILRGGVGDKARGQTTVEFALICLPFFIILFAIVDYAQIYFYKNSLQNALREATRFATAGRIIQSVDAGGNPLYTNINGVNVPLAINDSGGREASRNECIRWWFLSNCVIRVPITNITITSAPTLAGAPPVVSDQVRLMSTDVNGNTVNAVDGPGGVNDYVQVTVVYHVRTITPMFNYLGGYSHNGANDFRVSATAIVKNEPAYLNFKHNAVYSDEYPTAPLGHVYPDVQTGDAPYP